MVSTTFIQSAKRIVVVVFTIIIILQCKKYAKPNLVRAIFKMDLTIAIVMVRMLLQNK